MKKNFYFVRHGETDWNRQCLFQGRQDIPLNENGVLQAKKLAGYLKTKNVKFSCIYSSVLKRAVQTAQVLAENFDLKIEKSDLLKEINFGDLEGTKVQKEKVFFDGPKYLEIEFPNGEKMMDACARFEQFISELPLDVDNVLIVAHGALFKAVLEKNGVKDSSKYCGNCICVNFHYDIEAKKYSSFKIL